jgi:hypothetical protein
MKASKVLATLNEHGVDYVLVGRAAALLHRGDLGGCSLSLCYRQAWTNCECLSRALDEIQASVVPDRGAPIPVTKELRQASDSVRFHSPFGPICLTPTVPELGSYEDLQAGAAQLEIEGVSVPVLSLAQLDRWLETSLRPGSSASLELLLLLKQVRDR